MKRYNKIVVILVTALLGFACAGISYGAGGGEKYRPRAGVMFKKLNLTPQQETQLRQLRQKNHQTLRELHRTLMEKRKALAEELDKQKVDMAKIKVLTAELKDIEGSLIEERVNQALKMKEILTPEQYRIFRDTLKDVQRERIHRRGGFKDEKRFRE